MAKRNHSLISEDDNAFFVHDGESQFLVAKKGLGGDVHERIRGLPKFADGGLVEEEKPSDSSGFFDFLPDGLFTEKGQAAKKERAVAKAMPSAEPVRDPAEIITPEQQPQAPGAQPVIQAPETVARQGIQQQAAQQMVPVVNDLKAATNLQAAGIMKQADAQAALGKEQAALQATVASPEIQKQQQEQLQRLEAERARIDQESNALMQAAVDNKVDPRRVWNNMSTGNRIMATIGIILSGAGSGGQAANNSALNIINKAIDDDINAQMKDGENKRSLFQMNLQRLRSVDDAITATKTQMNAIVQGQMAGLAAKYQGPLAKAGADQLIVALKVKQVELQGEMLAKQQKALGQSAENFVPGYGMAQVKPSDADREALAAAGTLKKSIKELQARAAKYGTTVMPSKIAEENKTKVAALKLQLKTLFKLGQISETDAGLLDPLAADPGAWRTGAAIAQLRAAEQVVSQLEQGTLNKLGIRVQQESTAPKISFEEFKKRKKEGKL